MKQVVKTKRVNWMGMLTAVTSDNVDRPRATEWNIPREVDLSLNKHLSREINIQIETNKYIL